MSNVKEVEAGLEELAERESEVSVSQMATLLGLLKDETDKGSSGEGGAPLPAPPVGKAPASSGSAAPSRGLAGRPRGSTRGRGGRGGQQVSGQSLASASKTIEKMMRAAPEPVPTDTDVLEEKVDAMSTVSSRLEEDLEKEKEKRAVLEKRLEALEQSHNLLAGKYTELASLLLAQSKGKAHTPARGMASARDLISSSGSVGGEESMALPGPPADKPSAPQPRGGVAGRGRRGGF